MDTIQAALHTAGLDSLLPLALALHATASALDALIPQPVAGSHWLPLRKILSICAGNVANAANATQPAMITWVQRIAGMLVSLLPPAAAPPARIDPTIAPLATPPAPPAAASPTA